MTKMFSVAGGKADLANGVIAGCSVITGGVEAIGHGIYTDEKTLAEVKSCADAMAGGVRVKMNHGSGFGSIVGVLKNFRIELAHEMAMGDAIGQCNCVRADLHLIKSHPAFNQIVEMSAEIPESFGLSISFSGTAETVDGLEYARCAELYSVDLVDAPAANPNGLFSEVDLTQCADNKNNTMKFSISDFILRLTSLESRAASADKVELGELKSQVEGQLSQLTADLATAQASIASLGADKVSLETKSNELTASVSALDTKLSEVISGFKIEAKADATAADKIVALETFAKLASEKVGVPSASIPVGGAKAEGKTVTMSEFNNLSATQREAHFKSGGKLKD